MSSDPASRDEICPGCGAALAPFDGPTHRYIGASAACWKIYTELNSMTPAPVPVLLGHAYAVQHPGSPSPQSIQSVAVHLLAIYGVLERGVAPENANWVILRASSDRLGPKKDRFHWLTPPRSRDWITLADIVDAETAEAKTDLTKAFAPVVFQIWQAAHGGTINLWYNQFVLS